MSEDLVSLAKAYDAAWNAHDEEEVLRYYNDDVVIRLSPPPPPPMREVCTGKEQALEFVRTLMPGFHVDSTDYRATGDTVSWNFTVVCDAFRQLGADKATGSLDAVVQDGRIKLFHPTFDQATIQKIQAAGEGATTGSL